MLLLVGSAYGQVSIRVNIGTPPAWGPAGYDEVRYYYLPDVEAYYDVQSSMFIYISGNRWIHRSYLPSRYRNYDLYGGYKVVMNDYHGNSPYSHFNEYRMKYRKGYRGDEQRNVGERHEKNNNQERHNEYQPNRNYNNDRNNNHYQVRGNDENQGRGNGNNKNHERVNEKNKKEGHDNGKGKKD